jgi:hypothetical protein
MECKQVQGEFLSPIFSVPKKNGKIRLLLNLKQLNQHVPYSHFIMDCIYSALEVITQCCFMASLDLKDAYYSVKFTLITKGISDFVTTIRYISTQHTLMVCHLALAFSPNS